MRLQDEVRALVARDGLIVRRRHPELAHATKALVTSGELVAVLPGVYVGAGVERDFGCRVAAATAWDPDLVFVDGAAARLTFWPGLSVADLDCAVRWQRRPQAGYRFSRRDVPAELVLTRHGVRTTEPALTALDLCASRGGEGIDQALRTRSTTLGRMRWALGLTPCRPGNVDRRRLLLDSRGEPWSEAERSCHRMLRAARITGWRGNWPVVVDGVRYWLDVAFPARRLALEIDGRLVHGGADAQVFEDDRDRQNALVLAGWTVLRFTWRMLEDDPDRVVARVRVALGEKSSAR